MIEKPILYLNINGLKKVYAEKNLGNYQNIGVDIDGNRKILSQIIFKKRKLTYSPYKLYVDTESYQKEREKIIDYIIEEIIIKEDQADHSVTTIMNLLGIIIRFIDWADNEGVEFLANTIIARKAYEKYTLYLRELIRKGDKKNNTVSIYHRKVANFLRGVTSDTEGYITTGIKPIQMKQDGKNTEKNDDDEIAYFFSFYTQFFDQVADFLLEQKKYPLKLELPGGTMWVTPNKKRWIHTSDEKHHGLCAFNTENGQISSIEKMMEECGFRKLSEAKYRLKQFKQALDNNNEDFSSQLRLELGTYALRAYYIHFRMVTGMNDSTAATLTFNKNFEIEKDKQLFRNIKYRAGNKIVEFEIRKEMIIYFNKYIELRKFLLNGHDSDYLFFTHYGDKAFLSNNQTKGAFSSEIYHSLFKRVDTNLPNITSRKGRVDKLHYTIKKKGIIAASKLGQSNVETIVNHYHGETEESYEEEMVNYFDSLNKNLIFKSDEGQDTKVGQCGKYDEPKTSLESDSIKVDCKMPEGCLFCEEYGNHADELDIRKLWSLLYIINESRYVAKNEEHFMSVFSIVIERIEEIFQYIKEHRDGAKKLIDDIRKDVFEKENLTPYWEHKLSTLINIGVLR